MMGGLVVREPEGDKTEQMDPGNYQGVCYRYWDLGTHHQDYFFEGKHVVGDSHRVLITWEFPDERIQLTKDGELLDLPRVISKEFTQSLGKKAHLRQMLESWRGRDFTDKELEGWQLDKILGVNAMINIKHNDKGYATIAAVTPLMKNMQKKKPEGEVWGFSLVNDGPDKIPELTPDWIKDKIMASMEYQTASEDKTGDYIPEIPDPNGDYDEMNPPPPEEESSIPF